MVIYVPNHHVEHILAKLAPAPTDTPAQESAAAQLTLLIQAEQKNTPYQLGLRAQPSTRG